MRVRRNFDQIYATEADPWAIGSADSDRYRHYVERILASSTRRESVLEIGSGYGALLARLRGEFERLIAVELSAQAVTTGRERYPFIEFHEGSLANLNAALPHAGKFDTILVSDVFYYLREGERQAGMAWIADHLAAGGLAFLAGWSPGGKYLNVDEFRNLVARELAIEAEEILESGHALFTCRRRRTLVAVTVDYETWQPQPEGFVLDWEKDALRPTDRLLEIFEAAGARLTIFAEMGEYLWLREHRPALAERMAAQWREAAVRGHDVQLHLHPNWLPELNPRESGGRWEWDMTRTRAADYPGDLVSMIRRCKSALEEAIRAAVPDYQVTAFRAGTYEAQPFRRLHDALVANGIWCDSSVLPGDRRPDRHYDFRHAYADHQPWFASRYDPQLKAPFAEREIVELPIFATSKGARWTFDNDEAPHFARRLCERLRHERRRGTSEALRRRARARRLLNSGYHLLRPVWPFVNRIVPLRLAAFMAGYERERLTAHDYFVLVAHTKAALDYEAIDAGLRRLLSVPGLEFVSLTEMARSARDELELAGHRARERQPAAEGHAPAGRDGEPPERLRGLIPLDRSRVLHVGGGVRPDVLSRALPPGAVVVACPGGELVEAARDEAEADPGAHPRLATASFANGEFDLVYAEEVLERACDVDGTLGEFLRVLCEGGCIVATVAPDGLNPGWSCPDHAWRTIPSEVVERFSAAGFVAVEIETVDVVRELTRAPFPPSGNQLLLVRAWKREPKPDPLLRVQALTQWAYRMLDPDRSQASDDPLEILAAGHAWCWGYVRVLGEALTREGYEVRWVTMLAEEHPRGRGATRSESHEVLEVALGDGRQVVTDPTVGILFDSSIGQLLADPSRADTVRAIDDRYTTRRYSLYSTSAWYSRVRQVAVRRRPNARSRYLPAERVAASGD